MSARLNDVMIHINETLNEDSLRSIEEEVRHKPGVISVGHHQEKAHVMMVVYDSDSTSASNILHSFKERGLHAQLIGL